MAKYDNPAESNAIAKNNLEAALNDPAISDIRKSGETFRLVAQGFTLERMEDLGQAMLRDLDSGHLNSVDVLTRLSVVKGIVEVSDLHLRLQDLALRREELALKREMRARIHQHLGNGAADAATA